MLLRLVVPCDLDGYRFHRHVNGVCLEVTTITSTGCVSKSQQSRQQGVSRSHNNHINKVCLEVTTITSTICVSKSQQSRKQGMSRSHNNQEITRKPTSSIVYTKVIHHGFVDCVIACLYRRRNLRVAICFYI